MEYTEQEMELEFCRLVGLMTPHASVKIVLNCQITKKYEMIDMLKYTINLADFFNIKSEFVLV